MQTPTDVLTEARLEVQAAQQNLQEAEGVWKTTTAQLDPVVLLLRAAERRLEHANALLRSALQITNGHQPG